MDATAYLLGLGTGVIGWLAGLAASTFLQDREHFRRQRGAVCVLITEVDRVGSELGDTTNEWIDVGVLGNQRAIPEIHAWAHASIVEITHSDPSILRRFMELDRYLHNQKLFVNALREIREEVRAARDRERTSQEPPSCPADTGVAVQEILARLSTRQEERREETVQVAMEFVNMNHRRIVDTLSELRNSLTGLDVILKRQPSFNLKRLLGAPVVLLRDQSGRSGEN